MIYGSWTFYTQASLHPQRSLEKCAGIHKIESLKCVQGYKLGRWELGWVQNG